MEPEVQHVKARNGIRHGVLLLIMGGLSGCSQSNAVHMGPEPHPPRAAGAIHLFNGRSLDGWYTCVKGHGRDRDPNRVFTVQDGMIHITGQDLACLTTNDEYENYRLIAEYRWGEKTWPPRVENARDNGILVHSVGRDGAYGDVWMLSIEAQIIEGGTGDLLLVNDKSDPSLTFTATVEAAPAKQGDCWVYQPGGASQTQTGAGRINWLHRDPDWKDVKGFRGPRDVEKPLGDWNRFEIIAAGDTLEYILNGVTVMKVTKVQPRRGRIQIQSEMAEIFYRRFELTPLE